MTYDVKIMIITFYMSSRTVGENFVSIRQAVAEKKSRKFCADKQTDPNVIPSLNPSAKVTRKRAIRDCRPSPGLVSCGVCVVLCGVGVPVCYVIKET